MGKVLLVTVGGSPQPIITSIQTLQPERVIFFCSAGKDGSESQVLGKGLPCEIREPGKEPKKLPNLPTALNLGGRFQPDRDVVKIENPDNALECYRLVSQTIWGLFQAYQRQDIMADYTGGTKTMSLSLGMAAIDYEIDLYITTSLRTNIVKIERGELPERVSTSAINVERKLAQFLPVFLEQYNYPAAISQLEYLLQLESSDEYKTRIRHYRNCCLAFEAWDRFEHRAAFDFLTPFMRDQKIKPHLDFLKRVMHSRANIDEDFTIESINKLSCHGYEVVEDLILNAERRAKQNRYDDAVGRFYRALELLMQIHLYKTRSVTTAGMTREELASLLPEASKEKYADLLSSNNDRIKFGLSRGYELLGDRLNDPLGQLYKKHEKKITGIIKIRNRSLFAHGFRPISRDDYENFKQVAVSFINEAIELLRPAGNYSKRIQFPETLDV